MWKSPGTKARPFNPMVNALVAAAIAVALLPLACGDAAAPSPNPDPRVGQALDRLDRLEQKVRRLEDSLPAVPPANTRDLPIAPPPDVGALPRPTPNSRFNTTSTPPTTPNPIPTPHPANSSWVQQRLDAVIALYGLTPEGAALVRSLDVRQMEGEPGFFGSYGFKEWTGVGEAKPTGVIHELSHSSWGGFPVVGLPELSWDKSEGQELSPAIERYHADILAFMAQPPDGYEVFRQRLRNLPRLSFENTEPLFHSLEADLVYNTGGNLGLVPPILRKYWSGFLQEGPLASWYDAAAWFLSLNDEDRVAAGKYLGFEHLDLRRYSTFEYPSDSGDLISPQREHLSREERQRLFDFANQFDLLLGGPQKEENFQFWRGYLRDKVQLHRSYPDFLASLELPRASGLASALELLVDLEGRPPREQSQRIADRLPAEPFLVNFFPALSNRTLLELFADATPIPEGLTLQATASFVERLNRFSGVVNQVLAAGRDRPQQGAAELTNFLEEIDYEAEEDLRLFFDLFRDEDPDTAGRVVQMLDKSTIRRLMGAVPAQLRFTLSPEELLAKLDIAAESRVSSLKRGIAILTEKSSGNFIIDEPFLHQMFQVVANRRSSDAQEMVEVLRETPFPLEGFIQLQPRAAVSLLESDLETAVRLVQESDPVVSPPARIIYRLINADPVLAARLVQTLEDRGYGELVIESLAYLAYDKSRSERVPGLPISLERDGQFLRALLSHQGSEGLARRLGEVFQVYGRRSAGGQVDPGFVPQYRETLESAVSLLPDAGTREELRRIIAWAAQRGNAEG